MKKEETQGAQWFILKLIGIHLEQIAVHELKNSVDLLNYIKRIVFTLKMANMIKLKFQNEKNRQNFKESNYLYFNR